MSCCCNPHTNEPDPDCTMHGRVKPWYKGDDKIDDTLKEIARMLELEHLAKILAEFLHAKQTYDDQDYIFHIENVVAVLKRFNIYDYKLIIAAYLHDSVEDQQATFKLIQKHFGEEVMQLVNAVTNEQGVNRKERNLKTYQKLSKNPPAILVKLADRIANWEQSIVKKNAGFVKMYKKEYPAFKYALQEHCDKRAIPMWEHLDKLFETEV